MTTTATEGASMERTVWQVREVVLTEGSALASLQRVQVFKKNPAYTAMMEEHDRLVEEKGEAAAIEATKDEPYVDEFVDAEPGDPDGEIAPLHGETAKIDIGDAGWLPGDFILMGYRVVRP